jgi:dihydropyrimidinase
VKNHFDILVVNGLVVTGAGICKADVGIRGEKIAAVGSNLSKESASQTIDATGKFIFPGVIDVHIHPVYLDDVQHCSRLAAYGGTTTILHFAYARTGESLLQKVKEMMQDGLDNSLLDFSLHGGLFESPKQVPEIPQVVELGVRTFKFFMAYVKQNWYTDDYQLLKAMDMLSDLGGMAMVHAENGGGVDYLEDKYLTGPNASAKFFNATHPAALEEEAIFRAIRMAEVANCPLYVAHVTTTRGVELIAREQAAGRNVFAETCPQYLSLTEDSLKTHGAYAKIGPPLRSVEDQDSIWSGLNNGVLQIVSSDHSAKAKDINGDFIEQGYGSPQMETLLPILHDGGVNRGRISLVRMVQVLCENPARIFGLYPQKGTIAVGSDADLVVFDPANTFTITADNQHSNAGFTLYDGRQVLGWPEMTFQRGKPVMKDGQILAEPGKAKFLPTLETITAPLTP